jgi:steroid delta-isomerase
MPADQAAIRTTVQQYLARFSAGDREGWLALWSDDCTMEDPVGTPLKHGKDAIGAFYDEGQKAADSIELRPTDYLIVCGNQASFAMQVRPTLGGQTMVIPAIDVMTFDDDGRITSQRAFVDFTQLRPADEETPRG